MRIFIGIDLDPEVRKRIERFLVEVQSFAPGARWVHPESLHVTLKFIGEQSAPQVEAIAARLHKIDTAAFEIRFAGYGFFPTAKAPRVFWIGIQGDPELADLAANIDSATAELGIPPEDRPYSPHLTLARGGGKSSSGSPKHLKDDGPNTTFAALDTQLATRSRLDFGTPDFGNMTAREFILYQSQLSPGGSKYTRLQHFPLNRNS
jgi:2'-5' RNA ligase